MKKFLPALIAAAFISSIAFSQTTVSGTTQLACACNPTGWRPGTATIGTVTSPVNCGHQFALKCNEKITIKQEYKCIGTCVAKYSAVLKNTATGAVVMNYPVFSFPWSYSFLAGGTYSLEITPLCGNTRCTPCRYFFTVTCPVACDCKENGWQPFTAYIGTRPAMTVNCNHQFGLKKTEPFKLNGKYVCKGECTAKYAAVLKNNVTGAVVMNYAVFTFPWSYSFAAAGNYKLEITPICGTKRCQPCVFYFTVTN